MRLVKFLHRSEVPRLGVWADDGVRPFDPARLGIGSLAEVLATADPAAVVAACPLGKPIPVAEVRPLAPIDRQEVWAAGVTYLRSREAREAESESAASFYDKVYKADRPELFLKATPGRVSGPGQPIRARRDSRWSVPEPELALVVAPDGRITGYTIGNDVSARDIEGENPLYLPQAKIYRGACALGPAVTLAAALPPREQVTIRLTVTRRGAAVFDGSTTLDRMARDLDELVGWLVRETDFPDGAILLTGTGVVPPDDFTLKPGDLVAIEVTGVGVLVNPVVG